MNRFLITKIFFIISLCISNVFAQGGNERISVIGDSLVASVRNGESIREVIGNVKITQGNVFITCNKAVQFLEKNEVELIGNVEVLQDSVKIITDAGYYYGNDKIAYSDTGIMMRDGHMILAAMTGYYYMNDKRAYFYDNVKLVDEYSTLTSEKLTYFHEENKAVSVGLVHIQDSSSAIDADSLIHFRDSGDSHAFNNVKIVDSESNLTLFGDELIDLKKVEYTKITGHPFLIQIDTSDSGLLDTLIISAEVLESVKDSVSKLIASDSVKIIRGNFSSLNNHAVLFREEDRILTFRESSENLPPVLWYDNSQLVGDTVNIYLDDNKLKLINISKDAFILSTHPEYSLRFDQISGDSIKMFFAEEDLERTEVSGNVLSIYYMYEDSEPNGLIKSSSERTKIFFDNKTVIDVRLYGSPVSEYHPEDLVVGKEKDFTLPSFVIYKNRPNKTDLINNIKHLANGKF